MSQYPVFIVGSPRSGTSILVDALLSAKYVGFREGSFLSLIPTLERMTDRHFSTFADGNPEIMITAVDREALKLKIWEVFKSTTDQLNPTKPWFDKTGNPEGVQVIPVLLRLWPSSVFIFAKRRALENVTSRIKKFPQYGFEYHCADWAKNMTAWRLIKEKIPAGTFVEIDQRDIVTNPDVVADRIARLLRLDENAKEKMIATFRSNRPQKTDAGSTERVLDFAKIDWNDTQKSIFTKACSEEMKNFQYSLGVQYYAGND